MSVAEVTPRGDYIGNGSTTTYTYPFQVTAKNDIEVLHDGVVKIVDVDYTVTGVGNPTGSIVHTVVVPNLVKIAILPKQPISQLSVYQVNEDFPSLRVMTDLDKSTMVALMFKERFNRILMFAKKSLMSGKTVDDLVAGKWARVKSDVSGIEFVNSPVTAGSYVDPVTTKGDAVQGGDTGVQERLAIGNTDDWMSVIAGKLGWRAKTYDPNIVAKGDILVGTAANTKAKKTVGANGEVLMADSTQSDGTKYAGATDIIEAIVKRLRETGGPTTLLIGAIADGQVAKRSGTALVGTGHPFSLEFVSADQTITLGSVLNLAHGLGVKPKLVQLTIKNITTEGGYVAGDEMVIYGIIAETNSSAVGCSVVFDTTNITILTNATFGTIQNRSTSAIFGITVANWRYIVRAWA